MKTGCGVSAEYRHGDESGDVEWVCTCRHSRQSETPSRIGSYLSYYHERR
jgi:hypothetical protein